MKDYKITEMVVFVFGYMFLSFIFLIVTNNFISAWLGINVGLAIVPLILITVLYKRLQSKEFSFDWISIVLLVAFVFFFPNTFYVITDMIHIEQGDFYTTFLNGGTVYQRGIQNYLFLFHIVLTLAIGVYAGVKSLLRFNEIFIQKDILKGIRITLLFVLVFLSSIGIYIGRFLRFFSWDILRPFKLMNEFFVSLDFFAVMFVALFTVIQLTFYYGYRYFYESEPFN
jgi:uncharacterized membrane protein